MKWNENYNNNELNDKNEWMENKIKKSQVG